MNEKRAPLMSGQSFEGKYPFVRDFYDAFEADGPVRHKTWRPGVRHEMCGPEDAEAVADGEGAILLTIVSVHKPGQYPERVFCTRRWRDPAGREFGRGKLHIMTSEKFRRLARGYQYDYRMVSAAEAEAA